jgi:hypothetical protein
LALTLGDRLLVGLWELNLSSSYETLAKDETIGWPLGPKLFIKAWLNFAVLQKHDFCIDNIISKNLIICLKSLTTFDSIKIKISHVLFY